MLDSTRFDHLLGGRVQLEQPAQGYRAGMDAVVLAASVSADNGLTALELGTGAGAALVCVAVRLETLKLTGLERSDETFALATRNVELNGAQDRVKVCQVDVGDIMTQHREAFENQFDQCFFNPPFFAHDAITAPSVGRKAAYVDGLGAEAWIKTALFCTRPGGFVTLIHRAAELARLLAALDSRAGQIEICPIFARYGDPAKRVLIRARKGLRPGPVTLRPGLVLFAAETGQTASERAQVVYDGGGLDWAARP
jgi:tRNA1(Val) A37 N6-methylase TrmN6